MESCCTLHFLAVPKFAAVVSSIRHDGWFGLQCILVKCKWYSTNVKIRMCERATCNSTRSAGLVKLIKDWLSGCWVLVSIKGLFLVVQNIPIF